MLVMLLKNESVGFGVGVAGDAIPVWPLIRLVMPDGKEFIPVAEDIPLAGIDPLPDVYCPMPGGN
jgi:hypothetical protein